MPNSLIDHAAWGGLALLSLVFVANAVGLINPATAVRELAATGAPLGLARFAVLAGRVLQLLCVPALFFAPTRPPAALALAAFLIPATLTAHAFWKSPPSARDMQLASFLRNAAIIGGLIIAAGWRISP